MVLYFKEVCFHPCIVARINMNSKSDPKSVQDALHETAVFPVNFNLKNGQWESPGTGTNSTSTRPRTKLVFDPKMKKLLAMTSEQLVFEDVFHHDRAYTSE